VKTLMATLATTIALAIPATATADNYGGNSRSEQNRMVGLIYREFGAGWLGRTMVCIARRESGLNPRAANYHDTSGGSFGLFQINGIHARGSFTAWVRRMWNPYVNIASARALYRSSGLAPWGGGC
jgi:hypothetical protein